MGGLEEREENWRRNAIDGCNVATMGAQAFVLRVK